MAKPIRRGRPRSHTLAGPKTGKIEGIARADRPRVQLIEGIDDSLPLRSLGVRDMAAFYRVFAANGISLGDANSIDDVVELAKKPSRAATGSIASPPIRLRPRPHPGPGGRSSNRARVESPWTRRPGSTDQKAEARRTR